MTTTDRTLAQRQAAATARLLGEGGRRVTLRVPPAVAAMLDAERARTGESDNALILRLVQTGLAEKS